MAILIQTTTVELVEKHFTHWKIDPRKLKDAGKMVQCLRPNAALQVSQVWLPAPTSVGSHLLVMVAAGDLLPPLASLYSRVHTHTHEQIHTYN